MRIPIFLFLLAAISCLTGTCKLSNDHNSNHNITGTVVFIQDSSDSITRISYSINGLDPRAKHGIHVHEWGLIDGGCVNTGPHFNPKQKDHGSLTSWVRHIGDMGNLFADDQGKSTGSLSGWDIGLFGTTSVIGRGLVIVMRC